MPALAIQVVAAAPAASPVDILNNPLVQSPLVLVAVQVLKMLPVPFEGKTLAGIVPALTIATVIIKVAIAVLTHTVDQLDVTRMWTELYAAAITLCGRRLLAWQEGDRGPQQRVTRG